MNDYNYYCPLLKENCKESKCAWFVIGLNQCAANVIAQAVDVQADAIEEMKNEYVD